MRTTPCQPEAATRTSRGDILQSKRQRALALLRCVDTHTQRGADHDVFDVENIWERGREGCEGGAESGELGALGGDGAFEDGAAAEFLLCLWWELVEGEEGGGEEGRRGRKDREPFGGVGG
jgi:hypothetical protein